MAEASNQISTAELVDKYSGCAGLVIYCAVGDSAALDALSIGT
jgi:hypothetical protein